MWDGALILTARGRIPIEAVVHGDEVTTTSGQTRRIASVERMTAADDASPAVAIRIVAGGLGEKRPKRDTDLPPEAPVLLDHKVLAARSLVNGATIRREPLDKATCGWRLCLDRPEDRGATDPYLPLFDREGFVHQDGAGPTSGGIQAPAPMKRRLLDVAAGLGHVTTDDPGLHVLADGAVILPRRVRDHRYLFTVPPGADTLRLVSRTWVPAEMLPESEDTRVLGVCLRRLVLDGHELDLSMVEAGWDKVEQHGGIKLRWTKGSAEIPIAGRRALDLELYGFRRYWAEPPRIRPEVEPKTATG